MDTQSRTVTTAADAKAIASAAADKALLDGAEFSALLELGDLEGSTDSGHVDLEESLRRALEEVGKDSPLAKQLPEAEIAAVEPALGDSPAAGESLETVEFELALHNQNLVSLGFEESIRAALKGTGGEMLFQMRLEDGECQRVAAVRIGSGEEQEFALVIMPPGGGIMRVEPVAQSSNPLARIAESYAGLIDVFRTAA
jgi:hypothetical protein